MTVVEDSAVRARNRLAILDAAESLVQEGGVAALTTRAVAERAGVQAPAIYRLFGDKDGLVAAVAERALQRYSDGKRSDPRDAADPVDGLRGAWRDHVDFGLRHADLYRLMRERGEGTEAAAGGAAALRARIRAIAAAGLLTVEEPRAYALIRAAGDGVLQVQTGQPEHERDPGLPDAMLEAVLARITSSPGGAVDEEADPLLRTAIALRANAADLPALSAAERRLLAEWAQRALDALAPQSAG